MTPTPTEVSTLIAWAIAAISAQSTVVVVLFWLLVKCKDARQADAATAIVTRGTDVERMVVSNERVVRAVEILTSEIRAGRAE